MCEKEGGREGGRDARQFVIVRRERKRSACV
jgi:hypothetical protein